MENEDVKQIITAIISGDTISVLVKGTLSEISGVYGAITAAIIQKKVEVGIPTTRLAADLLATILAALDDVREKFFNMGEISKASLAGSVKNFLMAKILSSQCEDEESEEENYGEEDD